MRLFCLVLAASIGAPIYAQRNNQQQTQTVVPQPAIRPFRMPQPVGLSPQSIGLGPKSIGLSPSPIFAKVPISPSPVRQQGAHHDHGHHNQPVLYPFFGVPYFGDSGASESPAPPQTALDPISAANDTGNRDLTDQLQRLSAQIEDLQNRLNQSPAVSPAAAQQEDSGPMTTPPITVVLTDGKTLQTQNYAVIGDTFWDLTNDPARKIPLTTIDIDASIKVSAANGAEFPPTAHARLR